MMLNLTLTDPKTLAGDLNDLKDNHVTEATGLVSLVHQPTRGTAVLDRLFVSDECYADVKVLTSVVSSDQGAIVAVPSGVVRSRVKTREKVETMRRSPNQHSIESSLCDRFLRADAAHGRSRSLGPFLCCDYETIA